MILDTIKVKLLDFKKLQKYINNTYQEVYNNIYNLTTKDLKLITKKAYML